MANIQGQQQQQPGQGRNLVTNGLRGTMPQIFTGKSTTSVDFLCEFELLCNMNENNELIATPYLKVNLALSMI
jgi:hypothetical protein